MPKTPPKRAPRGRPARWPELPYVGGQRFKSIGETEGGTNEEHVKLLLDELPYIRMGLVFLNYTDTELEEKVRAMDAEGLRALMDVTDALRGIAERHTALVDLCKGAFTRVLIVGDRIVRGPREVAHA